MTERTNRVTGMREFWGIRGEIIDHNSIRGRSLSGVCARAIIGVDVATDNSEKDTVDKKMKKLSVTYKEMYEVIKTVEEETRRIKYEDRDKYEKGILKAYLKDWEKSAANTADNLVELVKRYSEIRDKTIDELGSKANELGWSVGDGSLPKLVKFLDVFRFFASLPKVLEREIGKRKISDIIELLDLDFRIALNKIVRKRR
jgi:hypothetical protein